MAGLSGSRLTINLERSAPMHAAISSLCGSMSVRAGVAGLCLLLLGAPRALYAQTCAVFEKQRVPEFQIEYGRALALGKNVALIGSPQDGPRGNQPGAVYPLALDGDGTWQLGEPFIASDSTDGDRFGAAIDIDGTTAVIGAPGHSYSPDNLHIGNAYVFSYDGAQWIETAILSVVEDHPQIGPLFGHAVAISNDVIAIGNYSYDGPQPINFDFGAVYIFRLVEDEWQFETQITSPDGQSTADRFGYAIDLQGDVLLVGMTLDDDLGSASGSAYVFRHDSVSWNFEDKLLAPDGVASDRFGTSVGVDGATAVIGAVDSVGDDSSSAYVFAETDRQWSFQQELADIAGAMPDDEFGTAVAIDGDTIVVGAPFADVTYPDNVNVLSNGGYACVFRFGTGRWFHHHNLRAKWDSPISPPTGLRELGGSVAIGDAAIFAGSPDNLLSGVWFFDREPVDCDANGVPDLCDPDCNTNSIADACDLESGTDDDCNATGQPDTCEATIDYISDNNVEGFNWGLPKGGDMLCLNHFVVEPGAEYITHFAVPWPPLVDPQIALTLVLYDDPNNDGDPSDASLLESVPAIVGFIEYYTPEVQLTYYSVPRTFVGDPGDSFFIGMLLSFPTEFFAALSAQEGTGLNWVATAPFGKLDLTNLGDNETLAKWDPWMIRALAMDCNDNGVWDECDIDSGFSLDADFNGIPDECESQPCPADLDSSGDVGPADLGNLLAAWGSDPGGPPDFNGNNTVGPEDLGTLLAAWGQCPSS
jgi:hypothetical protein